MSVTQTNEIAADRSLGISGDEVRDRRRSLGMSQSELGVALGIARNTIARWERGDLPIGSPRLLSLALDGLAASLEADQARPAASEQTGTRLDRDPIRALPSAADALIGRRDELAQLHAMLVDSDVRLVTLVGPGGVGKTRLAVEAARTCQREFRHGVAFVDLAPIANAELVPASIASAIGLQEGGRTRLADLLLDYLHDREILLVLDNFEQVLPAGAHVAELVAACDRVTVLITSREPLGVRAERPVRVAPLKLPEPCAVRLDAISSAPAVQLFVERCKAVDRDLQLDSDNALAMRDLCRHLDGLPLALELAAARLRGLPVWATVGLLSHRLDLMVTSAADRPSRHQSLRATIDWSYNLLSVEHQELFRRISVFPGGCTLEAIEAVWGRRRSTGSRLLALLAELVDKSLLSVEVRRRGAPVRYRLLETLREFAFEQLNTSGELSQASIDYRQWCLELVEAAASQLWGLDQIAWLDRLEAEHDNIRGAIEAGLAATATDIDVEMSLRVAAAPWPYWDIRGHLRETRLAIESLLQLPGGRKPTAARAAALDASGWLAYGMAELETAHSRMAEAHELWVSLGAERELAWCRLRLGTLALQTGDLSSAAELFANTAATAQQTGDRVRMAWSAYGEAHVKWLQGDAAGAAGHLENGLAESRASLGPGSIEFALFSLGQLAVSTGDTRRASRLLRECLQLRWETRDLRTLPETVESLANLSVASGDAFRAARLIGSAHAARQLTGVELLPWLRAGRDATRQLAQRTLGDVAYQDAWTRGAQASLPEIIDFALQPAATGGAQDADALQVPLTTREMEVAGLVAAGRSNREIASALVMSERTAETHVMHIRRKLHVSSRTEVGVWAAQRGLLAHCG